MLFIDFDYNWLFLLSGFIYFFVMFTRYRNSNARHKYESETKTQMSNLRKQDEYVRRLSGLSNSRMNGANNTNVNAQSTTSKVIDSITENNMIAKMIRDTTDRNGGNL